MKKYLGGAQVHCDGKAIKFKNPFLVTLNAFGKLWELDASSVSDQRLKFVPAKDGGYKGGGNFLKQWRVGTNAPKPNGKHEK